jgi:hypothetical protein
MNQYDLTQMKKHLHNARKALEYLSANDVTVEKQSSLLDAATAQFERAVLELRRLAERGRASPACPQPQASIFRGEEIYGEAQVTENGWLHIRLDTLLPASRLIEQSGRHPGSGCHPGSGYVPDSIVRLLNRFAETGGEVPFYEKAFLAIIERCGPDERQSASVRHCYDHDNKSLSGVRNALKGRAFPDDDQFELSLGLFTEPGAEDACHIYVLPEWETADFFFLRRGEFS